MQIVSRWPLIGRVESRYPTMSRTEINKRLDEAINPHRSFFRNNLLP